MKEHFLHELLALDTSCLLRLLLEEEMHCLDLDHCLQRAHEQTHEGVREHVL